MRITKENIEYYTELVNGCLYQLKSKYNVRVDRRYDYYAIDIYDNNDNCINTLRAGLTCRECYTAIYSIYHTLYMLIDMR